MACLLKQQNIKKNNIYSNKLDDEERMDLLIDSNDQIIEKLVTCCFIINRLVDFIILFSFLNLNRASNWTKFKVSERKQKRSSNLRLLHLILPLET